MGEVSTEKALGQALQSARQKAGLTQQELCNRAKLSYSTLAKIERGAIKTPSVFTVASIAGVLGISMDEIMGAVVDAGTQSIIQKKTSTSGVSFLYLDINGCLVRFFHGAFTQIAHETGVSSDVIESAFWHYNDAVCRGEMTLEDFNIELSTRLGQDDLDWKKYYMAAVEPIAEMHELIRWASTHYRVGLLSNIMPGFIEDMIKNGLLPDINYDAIVDSSQVKAIKPEQEIYEIAEKKAGVSGAKILFVDDSRTNLMAAERFDWKVMWFDDYRPHESAERIKSALEF
jgi:FMN phosphatase YigB (HAD superfamily)/DNA-binding XRE family transcriptional regulator